MPETKKKIRPLGNNLVIIPDDPETVTTGGIVLPTTAQEAPTLATVVAVGPGLYTGFDEKIIPVTTKVGDRVVYMRHAVTTLSIHEVIYHVISEGDILFIIEDVVEDVVEGE